MVDLAPALWNQRHEIASVQDRLVKLREAVAWPRDLGLGQWVQLYAFCLEFAPDLIVELGRGYGNSTCVFTEAANRLGRARVVSVGYDSERGWATRTAPRVGAEVNPEWFKVLEILHQDILETDLGAIFATGKRVLLFWDAHGRELALYLLGRALPHLESKEHVVVVHDITDTRYEDTPPDYLTADGAATLWLGPLFSPFEELIPLYDFLSRNNISFDTPENSLAGWRARNPEQARELEALWSDDLARPGPTETGHWTYFDLQDREDPQRSLAFPPEASRGGPGEAPRLTSPTRARAGVRRLTGGAARRLARLYWWARACVVGRGGSGGVPGGGGG